MVTSDLTYLSDDFSSDDFTVHGIAHIVKPEALLTGPTIKTSSLPEGQVGVAYSAKLEAAAVYGGAIHRTFQTV